MASPSSLPSTAATSLSWWERLSLKTKATALAVVLGVAPVLSVGATVYLLVNNTLYKETASDLTAKTVLLSDQVGFFMAERNGDIHSLSGLPIFRNAKLRAATSQAEKEDALNRFLDASLVYDSIAVFDLNGKVLAESLGAKTENESRRAYFQDAVKKGIPIIGEPEVSKATGKLSVNFAAPIQDLESGKVIGVVRARMPLNRLDDVVKDYGQEGTEYHINDKSGKFIVALEKEQIGRQADKDFASFNQLKAQRKPGIAINVDQIDNAEQFVAYAPVPKVAGAPLTEWDVIIATDTKDALADVRALLTLLLIGTGLAAGTVAVLATFLANRATRPIVQSAEAVAKIGQGKLDTRIPVKGGDELAALGSNINLMASQIQNSLRQQEEAAKAQLEAQAEVARQQEEAAKAQLEAQAEVARQQTEAAELERKRSEALQMELLELLQHVGGASEGDLTVRADVSAGEIGIVADFFNSIVESLRGIVSQVKQAAGQVNTSIGSNETVMGELAEQAQAQAQQITDTLNSVEQMALSIQQVAENARQAAMVSGIASKTAESGGETIDRTVDSILQLRETVAETAKKVKRLGESSQQISKVVSLINQIALQTNLLAINASIEAARAGEEGRGFAVVAEEVGALAAQSASATKEIEGIVEAIQRETSEVVDAMENGTTQVVEGTRQVEAAKASLNQIVKVSREIDTLLQSISSATVSQTETSQVVKQLMEQITEASERTSSTSRQVSSSLQETVAIAQQLQASVGTFKIEE